MFKKINHYMMNRPSLPNSWGFSLINIIFKTIKKNLKTILNYFKINFRKTITPGFSIFNYNFFLDEKSGKEKFRGMYALDYIKKFNPKTFLDVGSGGGYHSKEMTINGSKVTCVDYGISIYSKEIKIHDLKIINIDFNKFRPPEQEKYEIVWASHVLEHQRNIGLFIEKLIECCSENGHICITVPDPHINLLGGHVSMWSPGLLCYNIVLCGIDISNAIFIRGTNEFSIFFKPIKFTLPSDLSYDFGDLKKLSQYFPQKLNENSNSWDIKYTT